MQHIGIWFGEVDTDVRVSAQEEGEGWDERRKKEDKKNRTGVKGNTSFLTQNQPLSLASNLKGGSNLKAFDQSSEKLRER